MLVTVVTLLHVNLRSGVISFFASLLPWPITEHDRRLRFCEFCPHRRENPPNSQSEARFYLKNVNIIYALGSAHVNFAVLFAGFYSTSWFVSLT